MRLLIHFLILTTLLASTASADGLETLLRTDADLYRLPPATAEQVKTMGFTWTPDADRSSARAVRQTFYHLDVPESFLRLERGGKVVRSLELLFFTRGDSTNKVDAATFERLVENVETALTKKLRREPAALPDRELGSERVTRKAWVAGPHQLELSVASLAFVRLRVTPYDRRTDPYRVAKVGRERSVPKLNARQLRARVSRNEHGMVEVRGLPMVAQRKNYCAVASCEALLRYYGRNVDQHLLAEAADANPSRGTMATDLLGALRGMGRELDVNVRTHHLDGKADLLRHITDYNKLAKRQKDGVLFLDFTPQAQFYRQAERPLLSQIRNAHKADRKRFFEKIESHIDAGIPPLWTMMLNVVDERPAPPVDDVMGHMRTITGYNRKKQLILYRDTWGGGHERKAMSYDDAWLITTGLFTLEPKGVRP